MSKNDGVDPEMSATLAQVTGSVAASYRVEPRTYTFTVPVRVTVARDADGTMSLVGFDVPRDSWEYQELFAQEAVAALLVPADECPAGGAHDWGTLEEAGTGKTWAGCENCGAPRPSEDDDALPLRQVRAPSPFYGDEEPF